MPTHISPTISLRPSSSRSTWLGLGLGLGVGVGVGVGFGLGVGLGVGVVLVAQHLGGLGPLQRSLGEGAAHVAPRLGLGLGLELGPGLGLGLGSGSGLGLGVAPDLRRARLHLGEVVRLEHRLRVLSLHLDQVRDRAVGIVPAGTKAVDISTLGRPSRPRRTASPLGPGRRSGASLACSAARGLESPPREVTVASYGTVRTGTLGSAVVTS